ncbi:UNVERIFIED_CONTAM: hypothetical protein Scaly_2847800 [Sesamum calycinum]|uniref:Uncharacterized protein n=1 Tax=Sesamum calycinum TaxID=2727403 RepID=A0AAW2LI18_9LAMI
MYNKSLSGRAGLTLEFEDGVKTSIEWAKGQHRHMDGDKIRIILRLLVSIKCWRSQPRLAMLRVTYPKKLVKDFGLPVEKIHTCKNGCMLYWKDDVDLEYCKFCRDGGYKPARGRDPHRKKSPYAVVRHSHHKPRPVQSKYEARTVSFKKRIHPLSLHDREEPRDVRLGLCTDGFAPHGQYGRTSSCWPIIITPYNLAPGISLMWNVNDLQDAMRDRSTARVMGCQVCMDDTRAFHMQHGRKACYFDCHRQLLLTHHSYRRNKKAFTKNHVENKVARPTLTGD